MRLVRFRIDGGEPLAGVLEDPRARSSRRWRRRRRWAACSPCRWPASGRSAPTRAARRSRRTAPNCSPRWTAGPRCGRPASPMSGPEDGPDGRRARSPPTSTTRCTRRSGPSCSSSRRRGGCRGPGAAVSRAGGLPASACPSRNWRPCSTPRARSVGYTICNDMSSRSIEGENPLYLPQAKIYLGGCALGPWIRPAWEVPDPYALTIEMTIRRGGAVAWQGRSSTAGPAPGDRRTRRLPVPRGGVPCGCGAVDRHQPGPGPAVHARGRRRDQHQDPGDRRAGQPGSPRQSRDRRDPLAASR